MSSQAATLLHLPGLREDNPRDFLAALGFLRLASLQWPQLDAKLSWDGKSGSPCLHTCLPLPSDWSAELMLSLQSLASDPGNPLFHGEIIKTTPEEFRNAAKNALRFARISEHPLRSLAPGLYAAYSSQTHDKDGLHISGFSFANGQGGKKLLADVALLISELAPDSFSQSLAKNLPPNSSKSFRWNPKELRAGAYRAHDPSKKHAGNVILDFPPINILAFVGLYYFPCVPRVSGSQTCGLYYDHRSLHFEWPVWETPLNSCVVSCLVAKPPSPLNDLHFGILRRWSSRRYVDPKQNIYFAPAVSRL